MLQKALADYLKALAVGGRHSAKTIESYHRDLSHWVGFLKERYTELPSTVHNDPLLLRLYLRQRSEVEAYLRQRRQQAAYIRKQNEARFDPHGVRDRLLARRAVPEGLKGLSYAPASR